MRRALHELLGLYVLPDACVATLWPTHHIRHLCIPLGTSPSPCFFAPLLRPPRVPSKRLRAAAFDTIRGGAWDLPPFALPASAIAAPPRRIWPGHRPSCTFDQARAMTMPTALTLRRCCNCRRPFVGGETGLLVEENVEACCSECYWSACMDPTGVRRRTQARKRKREGGAAAAARIRLRRTLAALRTPVPSSARRGGCPVVTSAVAETWDADAVPPMEGTKWLGGCAVGVGGGADGEPGSTHASNAMFDFHMLSLGGDEGGGMTAG